MHPLTPIILACKLAESEAAKGAIAGLYSRSISVVVSPPQLRPNTPYNLRLRAQARMGMEYVLLYGVLLLTTRNPKETHETSEVVLHRPLRRWITERFQNLRFTGARSPVNNRPYAPDLHTTPHSLLSSERTWFEPPHPLVL
jgi:hypothetical protein